MASLPRIERTPSTDTADEPAHSSAEQAYAALTAELQNSGFDVVAPLRAGWYNDYIRELGLSTDSTAYLQAPPSLLPRSQRIGSTAQASGERHASGEEAPFALAPLPDFGRSGDALAILVGNSRAMWPAFLRWLKAQKDPDALSDPVDTFAAEAICGAVGRFAAASAAAAGRKAAVAHDSFWASDMTPARLVDMNRAARVAGVCYFSDAMFLSVHPTFGAWVAFRAVVVLDLDDEAAAAKAAFDEALRCVDITFASNGA
ncbi:hypothetical protein EMIHUDRAFT_447897 [Emiliania huxleyi CCMP1516]|uniref:Cyanocobalamin reductase (cyanide-eliminating) n=2 Tax=Emiliania huxleyi TaxID=2903 RepID=A0A0D3J387_EMIH1|nr:hypothetical protein EMIHUDRAFT_447897 [Emiliania huxleyi CCMP1516]EOD17972.1 hypothetical protein EMIHUDRAFT_447897 [Emiliania huxleyi CCMP1516]|eukprot:XP_005770401.1 hypothetical protein EMIHUDRAFT_447897 [Emiliania huxleyi CCMP1516]